MRNLTSGMKAAIIAQLVRPLFLVQVNTISGVSTDADNVRMWTGFGNISWNSKTWVGAGKFGAIDNIPENVALVAGGIKLTLSGIPSALLVTALTDLNQGLPATVWFGCFDASGNIIADPYEAFSGHVDVVQAIDNPGTSTIMVSVESDLIDLNRSRVSRYCDPDQQLLFPGDFGFTFVPNIQEVNLPWGQSGKNIPRWDYSQSPGNQGG
jgi:hypothetical protein